MQDRLSELEKRLADVGRQVRTLRWVTRLTVSLCLGFGTVGLALVGARPAETQGTGSVVRAPFRVVDWKGRTLLAVDVGRMSSWDELSGVRLRLFDAKGKATASRSERILLRNAGRVEFTAP
jgi:hypothetical protein